MVGHEGNSDYSDEESIIVTPSEQSKGHKDTQRQRLLKTLLIDMSFVTMVSKDILW